MCHRPRLTRKYLQFRTNINEYAQKSSWTMKHMVKLKKKFFFQKRPKF